MTALAADDIAVLRAESLTYPEVGRTRTTPPPGYSSISTSAVLATRDFAAAAHALLTWQVPLRAGLQVRASSPVVSEGALVVMRLGVGPASLRIPCRVVYVVDEPNRQGFAYGTLPGHPESGEESFVLHHRNNGCIDFVITAYSRPATLSAKLSGPVGRAVQQLITARYLRALDS